MLIVGSRGLGNLKGCVRPRVYTRYFVNILFSILLGSTSHYLIQKCSVPVMVARRRLKRPPRRSAHLASHRARVSLAEAAEIDRVATKVDQDVATMREQVERDEREQHHPGSPPPEMADNGDEDGDDVAAGGVERGEVGLSVVPASVGADCNSLDVDSIGIVTVR